MNGLEKEFRNMANAEVEDGIISRDCGFTIRDNEMTHSRRNISRTNRINKSTSQFAESCEHFLKAPIIFRDLQKSSLITSVNGEDRVKKIEDFLKSPKKIQESIITTGDSRKNISLILNSESQGQRISGHDIFAYYRLQDPTIAALINHEYLISDGEDMDDAILYALLTRDIFVDNGPTLTLPQTMLDSLDKNKASFENFRYSSTHLGEASASNDDEEFLIQMSGGLEHIMTAYYPEMNFDINESRLEHDMGVEIAHMHLVGSIKKTLLRLDDVSGYYMKNEFSRQEFESFINQLTKINSLPISNGDKLVFRNIYSNMCVYLKHMTLVRDIRVKFDENVFQRIETYCKKVMDSNLFDVNATQLRNNSFFISNKDSLEAELSELRKDNRDFYNYYNERDVVVDTEEEALNSISKIAKELNMEMDDLVGNYHNDTPLEMLKRIRDVLDVCNRYNVVPIKSMFNRNVDEIKKIIVLCKQYNIPIVEEMFKKSSNQLFETVFFVESYGMDYELPMIVTRDVDEIKKIFELLDSKGALIALKNDQSILNLSYDEIKEKIDEIERSGENIVTNDGKFNPLFKIKITYISDELDDKHIILRKDVKEGKIENASPDVYKRYLSDLQNENISQEKSDFYLSLNPSSVIFGRNAFQGFTGFVFKNGKIIFDTMEDDSMAIYVINESDLEELSNLSKQELANDYRKIRIFHTNGWQEQVARYAGYNENIKRR